MKKYSVVVLALVLIWTVATLCFAAGTGSTGAQFLKSGIGARPTGMGESFVGIANDASAAYWNPAGLAQLEKKEITAMYARWFGEIYYGYLGYIQPATNLGTFGAGVTYLTTSNISQTGVTLLGNPVDRGASFKATDMAITLSYGRRLAENISAGGTIKIIQQKIEEEKASGFAVDLGCLYNTPIPKLSAGLVIQNIGTKIKFMSEGDPLPLNIKLGGAYKLLRNDALTLALDINKAIDNAINLHIGGEYWATNMIALRVGYKTTTVGNLGALSGLSMGLGIKWLRYGIDYAWVPYGDLGNTHRFSIGAKL